MATPGPHFYAILCCSLHGLVLVFSADDVIVYGTVDESISLPCDLEISDPANVTWYDWVHNTDRNHPKPIFSANEGDVAKDLNHPNADDFAIDDKFTLTISQLSIEYDPGQYICRSTVDRVAHTKSYYLAIAGKPECSGGDEQLTAGETFQLDCVSAFAGNVAPVLAWYRGPTDGSELVPSVDHDELRKAHRTLDLVSVADDDGRNYTCRQTFGETVEQCWKTIRVQYGVQNVNLYPIKPVYYANDKVTCKARGQPAPSVQLSTEPEFLAGLVGSDSFLIPVEWIGQSVTVNCSAENTVNGELHANSLEQIIEVFAEPSTTTRRAADVTAAPDKESSAETPVAASSSTGIIIGVIVAVCVVLLVVVACICMRKRRQNKKKRGAKVPTSEAAVEMNSKNQSRA